MMESLLDAAKSVMETARKERMALAVVAERSGDAIAFFARSLIDIVGAWRKNTAGGFAAASKDDADLQSLYIRREDIESYLRWARTVK
jgi:hypothetical protein